MRKLLHRIEEGMDNLKIKKKLYMLYLICVLIPIIITDSVIFFIVRSSEQEKQQHEMANIANAVSYNISNTISSIGETAKSIYTSKYINSFLMQEYESAPEYVLTYQEFFKNHLLENILGMNNLVFTFYTDNETIVNGGKVNKIENIRETKAYQSLVEQKKSKGIFFVYDESRNKISKKRQIVFLQKLDFYSPNKEKILKVELDYGKVSDELKKMNYDNEVEILNEGRIVLSNKKHGTESENYEKVKKRSKYTYCQEVNLYGTELEIRIDESEKTGWDSLMNKFPIILLLIFVNVILPVLFVYLINRSFTKRITKLSKVFQSVNNEQLIYMSDERGKDEIGSMIRNYNRMVERTNHLIETVYKSKIREQEIIVGRKNAELLALHSQINPHFLFNALESIRMHSILKQENETADMVEKLALMQRQYVEWGADCVEIEQEIEFVKAYLALQKYRFGERLNYDINISPKCEKKIIPKLTLVTFVENACVHGIESKSSPGWIFVRIYEKNENLYIEIEDTGNGMSENEYQDLRNKMQNASIEMLKVKGRVGVINACLRLKIVSDDKVKFTIEGEEGVGTMVMIQIPAEYV